MNDEEIFKNGSTTYYWSSKFFPKKSRADVYKLYSFVRVVDDYVDAPKPNVGRFDYICKEWKKAKKTLPAQIHKKSSSIDDRVLNNILYVVHHYDCDPAWIDAFLASMKMDLDKKVYRSIDDTLEYIYGSAEVIGLLMAKVLGLPKESYESARMQGRAMQYINFIRDIAEDNLLGRQYFPDEELVKHGLKDLSEKELFRKPAEFREFISAQVGLYNEWQCIANKGFRFIPKRPRVAVRTAVDMYNWTAKKISQEPALIFESKVKPSKGRVIKNGLYRTING